MLKRSFSKPHVTYVGRAAASLIALGLLFSAAPARAQSDFDRTTARTLGQEGHAALDRNDWAAAADSFSRAEALVHAPTFLLGFAQAQVGRGKLVSALEAYNRILREELSPKAPPAFVKAVETARTEFDALQPRIPYVLIQLGGQIVGPTAAVKVTIDGVEVPRAAIGAKRAVDAGQHTITATYEGWPPVTTTLVIAEGRTETVTLEQKPEAPRAARGTGDPTPVADGSSSSGSARRTLGIVGMAAGGAGLIVGAAMGGAVLAKHSSLTKSCPGGKCPIADEPTLQSSVDQYHAFAAASTAGFVVGGVLAAAGIVLFVTAPKASPSPAVGLVVRPTWVGLGGSFR